MKELDKSKIYDLRNLNYKQLKNLIYGIKGFNFRYSDLKYNTLEYCNCNGNNKWNLTDKEKSPHHVNALTLFDPEANIINKQSTNKVLPKMTEEKTTDKIVLSVMNDLNERSKVGIKKYGVTLERKDLEIKDWINHAYEETLDKANYLKVLKTKFDHLNSYELELIDLIINCRKSGTFSEDLTKAKKRIKKYLINYNSDK